MSELPPIAGRATITSSGVSVRTGSARTDSSSTEASRASIRGGSRNIAKDASDLLGTINESDALLKDATKIVRAQISAAKDLRAALENKNTDAADLARARLEDLQEKREELGAQVHVSNTENSPNRSRVLSSNGEATTVSEVTFSGQSASPGDLSSSEKVSEFINALKEDRKEIVAQRLDLREVKKEISSAIRDARTSVSGSLENSLGSIDEAEGLAFALSENISRDRSEALLAQVINEETAQALLR